jgi:4-hydroxy-tetrahydrodipicolinate synthase
MPVHGVLPVIPTPFRDGVFDRASFERFVEHLLPGVDGITLLGSTGEAPSMTIAQRLEIAEFALGLVPPGFQVVVGVSHTSAEESVALARHAQEHGAAGVLCSVPYYFANSADGVLRHLEPLDAALEVELVLYDNPVATKTTVPATWALDWAGALEHLTAVKLTDHDLTKIAIWRGAGLSVFAGDDAILFRYLAAGVDGAMVIAPAVLPGSFREVWSRLGEGDVTGALDVFAAEIAPFVHLFGIGDEIATTKSLLGDIGVFASDELLPPLTGVDDGRRALLRRAYDLGRAAAGERVA